LEDFDDEPDDSFLNAALAKARRLNRLREMNQPKAKGADAVALALKKSGKNVQPDTSSSGITFAVDDTREFTRAIQARAQQEEREKAKAAATTTGSSVVKIEASSSTTAPPEAAKVEDVDMKEEAEEDEQYVDIHELAKEVRTDDVPALEGATSESTGVGRGLSSFVSMLKHTGEISGKHTKEELRGRAKDEKNYDNYEKLDLSKVVKIGRNANAKDKEFAGREIKLEYRDKHGRLLTQKEAYRDLCYQFHGHSGSKKKEEKKLRLIAQENAEARLASRQAAAGTLGALKATQKATGKAFIVHKT
jgi:U4/U6.U5 tri-snRNP-associated protein 1